MTKKWQTIKFNVPYQVGEVEGIQAVEVDAQQCGQLVIHPTLYFDVNNKPAFFAFFYTVAHATSGKRIVDRLSLAKAKRLANAISSFELDAIEKDNQSEDARQCVRKICDVLKWAYPPSVAETSA